ncbi:hypothetical protein ACFX12_014667 [Malus domestica]
MENITLETRGKISILCSLTGTLHRKLELECSTPRDGFSREMIRETSPEKKPVIHLFPLLEWKKDKGKKKEDVGTNQLEEEEFHEISLP